MSRRRSPSPQQRFEKGRKPERRIPAEVFERARQLHRARDLEGARRLYAEYLSLRPNDAAALHLSGFAEFQSLRFERAARLIQQAVAICPTNGEYHNSLALTFLASRQFPAAGHHASEARRLGHLDGHGYWHVGTEFLRRGDWAAAQVAMQLCLLINPNCAEAHNGLGMVAAAREEWGEAERHYRRALDCAPRFPEAWNNLGNLRRDRRQIPEAIALYRRAIEAAPEFALAHINLGVALVEQGSPELAIPHYEFALQRQPDSAEAWNNLGNACRDLGDDARSLDCYLRALHCQPASPEIQSNLAVALRRAGRIDEALAWFRRAIMLQPNNFKVHHHLASALHECGRLSEATACYRHLHRLSPGHGVWRLQSELLCPMVFADRGEMDEYWRTVATNLMSAAEQPSRLEFHELADVVGAPPFHWQYHRDCIRSLKESYARIVAGKIGSPYRSSWVESWQGPRARPRLGVVVTDGHEGIFLRSLQGVLSRLRGFEVLVFCSARGRPAIQRAFATHPVQVVSWPSRFDHAVRAIDEAQCDLLYYWEIGTDSWNYLLPFFRIAPIQFTSWGIQLTSGIPLVDYYVSSRPVESVGAADHYSEELVLADTLLTYRDRSQLAKMPSRASYALPPQAHWYVCAQQVGKIHVDFDQLLGGILRADPDGVLVLTGDKQAHINRCLMNRLRRTMPDVVERVHLIARLGRPEYLGLLQLADVLLDPLYFGGVNSTYDALSLGKPIVVLPTEHHRGRYTLGCYRTMQWEGSVAASPEDYVQRAVQLATDRDLRQQAEAAVFHAGQRLFANLETVRSHETVLHDLLGRRQSREVAA